MTVIASTFRAATLATCLTLSSMTPIANAEDLSGGAAIAIGRGQAVPRFIAGLEPERIGPRKLQINPGSVADSAGANLYRVPELDIDLDRVGVGGIDRPELRNGTSYQVYLVRQKQSGAIGALISPAITYGEVQLPPEYTLVRKLMFGFVYDETRFGGIPTFHHAYGAKGLITFTGADTSENWIAVRKGQAGSFAEVDLSKWLPDAARLARVLCITSSIGMPGKAYLRSTGAQNVGIQVGAVGSDPDVELSFETDIRVTSTRKLSFRTTGGARLTIVVLGYSMTEPS